jgi:flavin-dependent dehydrogenase
MKIAIVGAGMTGAYLYKLLVARGHSVDIFDKNPGTRCGLTPCAWGTSRGFAELVKASGLDPSKYILQRPGYVIMDGLKIGAEVMTIDKRMLIKDLLQDVCVSHSKPNTTQYPRIIDATGVSRAFLPSIDDDFILPCVQFRVRSDRPLENQIKLGGIGYAWCFPLSGDEYHIGCGSLISDPRTVLKELGWTKNNGSRSTMVCACTGGIRLAGPQCAQPFFVAGTGHEIWGVGEAIGCVAPLAGDGIIPGMQSAQMLMEHWNDPSGYTNAILREFKWMEKERRVVDRLRNNKQVTLSDAWVLKKNSRRMAMDVGLKEAAMLLKHLR